MATHDYIISNASGAAVRSDLNNALAAIVSNNSAATEPTTTYAYMWWADTTAGQLKLRNAANDGWVVLQELDGTLLMEDGTVGAPGLAFASDLDTGFYRPAANELGIATGGTNAIYIDDAQQVGLGISSPSQKLHIGGENPGDSIIRQDATTGGTNWEVGERSAGNYQWWEDDNDQVRMTLTSQGRLGIGTTPASNTKLHVKNSAADDYVRVEHESNDTQLRIQVSSSASRVALSATYNSTGAYYPLAFLTSDTERARIDTSGRLLVNTPSARNVDGISPKIQVEATDSTGAISIVRNQNATNAPTLAFGKTRGGSNGSVTIVNSGDNLGEITWNGADGANLNSTGASIKAEVDGTPGSSDMPGRLVFSTTADGASSPTERMRIRANGNVSINNGIFLGAGVDPGSAFYIGGGILPSGAGTATLKWNGGTGQVTYDTSSSLVKTNIEESPYGLEAVKQLSPKKYYRVDDEKTEIGFIADDLVDVLPELVPTGPKSIITKEETDTEIIPLGVNYDRITAVLVKALQEAAEKIETLEAKVAALEAQ